MCAVVHCTHHQSKCVPIVHDQQLACLHASQHLCLLSQQVCQSQGIDVSVMADLILGVAELLQAKVENLHALRARGLPKVACQHPRQLFVSAAICTDVRSIASHLAAAQQPQQAHERCVCVHPDATLPWTSQAQVTASDCRRKFSAAATTNPVLLY